jgi:2'-5' RNA ligase
MRSFVAVEASCVAITNLQNEILSTASANMRELKPVEPENFHFTLIFLGETSDQDLEKIQEKLGELQFEPFTLTYSGIGGFPNPTAARVAWIGVDQVAGRKLTALAEDVIAKMSELGFKADKPFSPHMTILRTKGRPIRLSEISAKYHGRTLGSELVDRVQLKKSILTRSGPIYSNIYTVQAHK